MMARSTPLGQRGFQALPPSGLEVIKEKLRGLCVWSSAAEYEKVWKNCMDAIGQACKHARKQV
jgi:hypothetical protein